MAIHLKVNGSTAEVTDMSLSNMQALVGGFIEVVSTNDGRLMVVDEEGKGKGKPVNEVATALTRGVVADNDLIVGDVIIASTEEIK